MVGEVNDDIDPVNLKPEELDAYLEERNLVLRIVDGQICMVSREDLDRFDADPASFTYPESKIEFSGVTPEDLVEQLKGDGLEAEVIDGVVHVKTEMGTIKLELVE